MQIKPGIYQHYKGNNYEIIGTGKDTETLIEVVIYREAYGDRRYWIRPLTMFLETVYYENKQMPRFKLIK